MEGQGTKLWTLSADGKEYERMKNLLNGRLTNSFTPEQINAATRQASLAHLQAKKSLEVIYDGSDIRKPYSQALPHLTSVRSLSKSREWIKGYNTFNSVVISDVDKQLHLLQCTPYSYADPQYNQSVGAGYTEKELIEEQIRQNDQVLKAHFPGVELWHLLDRKHDDEATFELIASLESKFIIRLKASRNSNETYQDEQGKTKTIKLLEAQLETTLTQVLERFVYKKKAYQQAKLTTSYGKLTLSGKTYWVVRIQVSDRQGQSLFQEPMLLLTNAQVKDHQQAFQVYQRYLKRSKIESVFKFLKEELVWEQFQIRDFLAIQNIIVLCFFVAQYFYENQPSLCQDTSVALLCKLAKSKGKITQHFYQKGLAILANYLLMDTFIKENNLSQEDVNHLLAKFRWLLLSSQYTNYQL